MYNKSFVVWHGYVCKGNVLTRDFLKSTESFQIYINEEVGVFKLKRPYSHYKIILSEINSKVDI